MDGDGDTDVLSTSLYDGSVAWYENDGSQNFIAHIMGTVGSGAMSVIAADVDSDGDLDVLATAAWNAGIAWYENKRTIFGSNPDATDAPDPLPLPPPPLPIGHTLYFGAATVRERSSAPLPNGRGSEELSVLARAGSRSAPPITSSILPYLKISAMQADESYVALLDMSFAELTPAI